MPTDRTRIEQLESLATDQGRILESVARAVADLTTTVDKRIDQVREDIADIKAGQARLQQTQEMILAYLREKLP